MPRRNDDDSDDGTVPPHPAAVASIDVEQPSASTVRAPDPSDESQSRSARVETHPSTDDSDAPVPLAQTDAYEMAEKGDLDGKRPEIIDDEEDAPAPPTIESKILSAALRKPNMEAASSNLGIAPAGSGSARARSYVERGAREAPRPADAAAAIPRVPLVPILQARLVENDSERPVYDAVQVGEEHWAKRHERQIIVGIALTIAVLIAFGVLFGNDGSDDVTGGGFSSGDPGPARNLVACFVDHSELQGAVDDYLSGNLSLVEDVTAKYGMPIGNWCVSNVTDMSKLFQGRSTFNEDLSNWDTARVTDMYRMFEYAYSFNGDISNWNTSSVQNMSHMFIAAKQRFNGDISNWNTSSVIDMRWMFTDARSFNADVSNWDTSSVTSMYRMFYRAWAFNRDVSKWNTSSVTDMWGMFTDASSFNQNLCDWSNAFPYDAADFIFSGSGCTFQDDPQYTLKGPFCASACNSTR